jgi:hypothetical protein
MKASLPHDQVFTRIARSDIAGVGVFAIRPIPRGTALFANDHLGIRWVDRADVAAIADPALRALYDDFAIRHEGRYGCPVNFNTMTMGWYLNEPRPGDLANVIADSRYHFHADRDIALGEELTIRYSGFSQAGP